jgi:hypothetical protein
MSDFELLKKDMATWNKLMNEYEDNEKLSWNRLFPEYRYDVSEIPAKRDVR